MEFRVQGAGLEGVGLSVQSAANNNIALETINSPPPTLGNKFSVGRVLRLILEKMDLALGWAHNHLMPVLGLRGIQNACSEGLENRGAAVGLQDLGRRLQSAAARSELQNANTSSFKCRHPSLARFETSDPKL